MNYIGLLIHAIHQLLKLELAQQMRIVPLAQFLRDSPTLLLHNSSKYITNDSNIQEINDTCTPMIFHPLIFWPIGCPSFG